MTSAEINQYIKDNYLKMSGPEMAEALGMSAGTVRARASRMGLKRPSVDYYALTNDRLQEIGSSYRMVRGYTNRQKPAMFQCTSCNNEREFVVHSIIKHGGVCYTCGTTKKAIHSTELAIHPDVEILEHVDKSTTPTKVRCKVCEVIYLASPRDLTSSTRCKKCAVDQQRLTLDIATKKVAEYGLELLGAEYIDNKTDMQVYNPSCGHTSTYKLKDLYTHACRECAKVGRTSSAERTITGFIKSLGLEVETEYKMPSGKHIDIYIPEKSIGIEYNGEYWHSSKFKDKNYHINKTKEAASLGITLIHIYEVDFSEKPDLVLDMLSARCGHSETLYARKCEVREITVAETGTFLDSNHLQGRSAASVHLGLYYEGDLVSVMTFGTSRFTEHEYEVIRLATINNFTVVGGASKLFKYFQKLYSPKSIMTYSHAHHSTGAVYEKLGFTYTRDTLPGYWYHKNGDRLSRHQCQKGKLQSRFPEHFDDTLSEEKIMELAGWARVYDCGNRVFDWFSE